MKYQWKSKKALGIISIAVIMGVLAGCGNMAQSPLPDSSAKAQKQEYVFKEALTPEEIAQRPPTKFDPKNVALKKSLREITLQEFKELGQCKEKTSWLFTDEKTPINAYEKVLIPYVLNAWDVMNKRDNERFAELSPDLFALRKNNPEKFKELISIKQTQPSVLDKTILHGVDVVAVSDSIVIANILMTSIYKIPVESVDGKFIYSKTGMETIVLMNAGKVAKYQFFIGKWDKSKELGVYKPNPDTKDQEKADMEKFKQKAKLRYGVDDLKNYK